MLSILILSLVIGALGLLWFFILRKKSGPAPEKLTDKTLASRVQSYETDTLFKNLMNDEKILFRDEQKNGFALVIENGHPRGKKIVLIGTHLVVGRSPVNEITIDDPMCSEKHFRLELLAGEAVHLEDLGSTNGTFINGKPVSKAMLRENDLIKIGYTELRFIKDSD